MGSLGLSEILLILVIGFLIFGPEKLPKILKNVGKSIKKLLDVKDDLQSSLNDVKETINDEELDDSIYKISKNVKIKKPINNNVNKKENKKIKGNKNV